MKGLYILIFLIVVFAVLGYLVVKPTDSDLRRTFDRIKLIMDQANVKLAELQPLMTEIRSLKPRTGKLDKEYDQLRNRASQLQRTFHAAAHNMDNLNDRIRQATADSLVNLSRENDKLLSGISGFSAKVKMLHKYIKDSYPMLKKLASLQEQLNLAVKGYEQSGAKLPTDMQEELEYFHRESTALQSRTAEALKVIHTNTDQGQIMAETALNGIKKLIPTLEAFLQDLNKTREQGK